MGKRRRASGRATPGASKASDDVGRFIAVHEDVAAAIKQWSKSNDKRAEARKITALIKAFESGREPEIQSALRGLSAEKVESADTTLVELGPKKKKGGAPRVFVLRALDRCAFFVSAGVEKGSSGAKELVIAKDRASKIGKA